MPTITVDLDAIDITVSRRVVLGVIQDLAASLGLPHHTKVMLPDSSDAEDLPISTKYEKSDSRFPPNMTVIVNATETYDERGVMETIQSVDENPPILLDEDLGVTMAPMYVRSKIELEMTWRFPSKSLADRTIQDIRRYSSLFRKGLFHEINYSYHIPGVNLVILDQIHKTRESQAPLNEDMTGWFNRCMSPDVKTVSNREGTYLELAKEEVQSGVMGTHNYELVPEEPEDGVTGTTHKVVFNYELTYDKPISMIMRYPILIHNVPLSNKFYDTTIPYELGLRLQLNSKTKYILDQYSPHNEISGFPNGAPVPPFNDWQPSSIPIGMEGILRVMLMVDKDNPRDVLDLKELGYYRLTERIENYMRSEGQAILKPKESAIFIALYEGENIQSPEHITIDEDLVITSTGDLDIRKNYHLMVFMYTDLLHMTQQAQERLREDVETVQDVVIGVDNTIIEKGLVPNSIAGGYVPKREFEKAARYIQERRRPSAGPMKRSNFRVGQFLLTAEEN
tara:strand:- start:294 stop:1820 length:1527 start_codon:yes stop_codon:yes gene_type:complete